MSKQIWPPSAKVLAFNINAINRIKLMLKQIRPPSAKILAFKIVNKDFADFRILATSFACSSGIDDAEWWFYDVSWTETTYNGYIYMKKRKTVLLLLQIIKNIARIQCPVSKIAKFVKNYRICQNLCPKLYYVPINMGCLMFPPMSCLMFQKALSQWHCHQSSYLQSLSWPARNEN